MVPQHSYNRHADTGNPRAWWRGRQQIQGAHSLLVHAIGELQFCQGGGPKPGLKEC